MKAHPAVSTVIISLCLFLSTCGQTSAGPTTWIDQPLYSAILPNNTVNIQVHASDADGVSNFIFSIGEQPPFTVPAGGQTLEVANVNWQPIVLGEVTIRVKSVDAAGNLGPEVQSRILIGELALLTDTLTPIPGQIMLTPATMTPSLALTTSPAGCQVVLGLNANCREGPGLHYEVRDIFLEGDNVQAIGRSEDSGWFYVFNPMSGKECWLASSTVSSSCEINSLPKKATPKLNTTTPTFTQPPPLLTSPPSIQHPILNVDSVNPTQLVVQSACTSSPQTALVTVSVSDPTTVVEVYAWVEIPGTAFAQTMNHIGGGIYQTTIGPFNNAGAMEVYAKADLQDGFTLTAGPIYAQILNCIE